MSKSKCIEELLESLVSKRDIVLTHKVIQSAQFQADLENPNVHILQRVTLVSIKMRYRMPCAVSRVSSFLPQH